MQLFGGTVQASSLSMERPFGVAPSLTADLALDDIDLQSLTGVFDFGSITGRLDGRIDALRLVDWSATAFDAELHTVQTAWRQASASASAPCRTSPASATLRSPARCKAS